LLERRSEDFATAMAGLPEPMGSLGKPASRPARRQTPTAHARGEELRAAY
jgi:hypothetical protein